MSRGKQLDYKSQAKIFKALGNETRLNILYKVINTPLECPEGKNACVGKIASEFNYSLPTISRHLKELKDAGIVKMNKVSNKIFIEANFKTIEEIKVFLEKDLIDNIKNN